MNNSTNGNKIIVALATPYGRSAIAAIRVSGDGCIATVERFLARPLAAGKLSYNTFLCDGFKENLTAVCYKAPRSYTGEDTVELFPHGNMTVCDIIIKTLAGCDGVRLAERGEFTKRAFLNGKLDLMQCEALADIIDAETAEQLEYGNKRYDGGFKELSDVEKLLKTALATVEAALHYSDELEREELDDGIVTDVYGAIERVIGMLESEVGAFSGGRIINDGFKVALIGAPNVGKSTLLNALVGSDRAIVTDIAGTTRDTVEGEYVYNGRKFVVTDTAGLTQTDDVVESIGVERAKRAAECADAVVIVSARGSGKTVEYDDYGVAVTVENKCDGARDVGAEYERAAGKDGALELSAKNGINITALKQKLYDIGPKSCGALCNHRQYDCAVRCLDACKAARAESAKAQGLELVAAALYEAYSHICALFGTGDVDENVISAVFERFCVGK